MGFKSYMGIKSYTELPREVFEAGKGLLNVCLFTLAFLALIGIVLLWLGVVGFTFLSMTTYQFVVVLGALAATYAICYVLDLRARITTLEERSDKVEQKLEEISNELARREWDGQLDRVDWNR